ncbi:hypothetical protein CBS101457_004612 [Exobasidium rhododendri]|nr:hypothetical protein CBS101457_004612 [Exobasidium rhododendri]
MPGGLLQKIKNAGQAQLAKLEDHNSGYDAQGSAADQSGHYSNRLPSQAPLIAQGGGSGSGKMNIGYFTNWSIYGRKYLVSKVPAQSLSHVLYAFADVRDDGEVFLTDSWADVEIHYDGDSWNDTGKNLYGCFKQLLILKRQNRHLKLLLSIGGWTYSSHFKAVRTAAGRSKFVASAMKILEDVGLDGLDIDWEYPKDAEEAHQYVLLLAELRNALNARANAVQARHWLSIAAPCGEQKETLNVRAMDQYLDMWNLMAYDFSGTWSRCATHQANLFPSQVTETSVDTAVSYYLAQGVAPGKLVMGMPLYARAFAKTGGLGQPFKGVPEGGAEPGNFFYSDLPLPGHTEHFDNVAHAIFSQNVAKGEIASYEGPASVDSKVKYIHDRGLAGSMWWELSGDCDAAKGGMERALIPRAAYGLGQLESTPNNLHYPYSQYDNVRSGI